MSRAPRQQRILTGRHLSLERLEPRQLLSDVSGVVATATTSSSGFSGASPASGIIAMAGALPEVPKQASASIVQSVITTVPANGASLTRSPSSLIVTFSQEVDFLWWDGDVQLERLNADGSTTPVFDPNNVPTASFDPTGMQATIPLDQPLTPGHYRVVLTGASDVSSFVGAGLWDSSIDQTLADFDVVRPGVTLNNATNLGTVGAQVQSVSGVSGPLRRPGECCLVQGDSRPWTLVAFGRRAGCSANR